MCEGKRNTDSQGERRGRGGRRHWGNCNARWTPWCPLCVLLTWTAHAPRATCLWETRLWSRRRKPNTGLHMLIWVCVPFSYMSLHLRPRASGSLPSLPAWVCPVGSFPPARWVDWRAGSPGPRGVLSPAPAALSRLVSPRAACNETQMITAFFFQVFSHLVREIRPKIHYAEYSSGLDGECTNAHTLL